MLYFFENNGLKFYPTDISGNPNPIKETDLPHCNFTLPKHFVTKFWQAVDFADISVIQVVSSAPLTVGILNLNTLVSEAVAGVNIVNIGSLGTDTIYEITVNWSSYTNISNEGKGMQITINNGSEYAKSEPIKQPKTFIKLSYQNTRLHSSLGVYTCDRKMIMYIDAYKEAYTVTTNKEAFETSVGGVINLKQDAKETFTFRTSAKPLYIHNILSKVFMSDILEIEETLDGYTVTESVIPLADATYDFETVQGNTAGEGQIQLFKIDSYVKKFVSENTLCDRSIEVKLCGAEGQTADITNLGINPVEVGDTFITEYNETDFVRFEKVEINGIAVSPTVITENIDGITDYIKIEMVAAEEDPIKTVVCFYFRDVKMRANWDFTDNANKIIVNDGVNDKATAVLDKTGNNYHLITGSTANAPYNDADAESNVLFDRPLGGASNLDSTLSTQRPAVQGSPITDPTGTAVSFGANSIGVNITPFNSPMHFIKVFKEKYPNDSNYRSNYIGTLFFEIRTDDDSIGSHKVVFGERPKIQPTKEFVSNTQNNVTTQGYYDDFTPAIDYTQKRMLSIYGENTNITNDEFVAISDNTEELRRLDTGGFNDTTNRLARTRNTIRFSLADAGTDGSSIDHRRAMHYYAYEMEVWQERLTTSEVNARYTALSTKHSF